MNTPWGRQVDPEEDAGGWRVFRSRRMAAVLVLIAIAFVVLLTWQVKHGRRVCTPPTVPVSDLDPHIPIDACATIGPERLFHGVWVDMPAGSLFYPDQDKLPRDGDRVRKTDSWVLFDPHSRDGIGQALPIADRKAVAAQVISISFDGVEYDLDRPTPDGIRRFFDVRRVRAFRLIQRQYRSLRSAAHR